MIWTWIKRTGITAIVMFATALVWGLLWPLEVHRIIGQSDYPPSYENSSKPFVGLALSGGGARAALFGAAGMEALEKRGLLTDVTHISSVSGGGFPASYLATNPVPDCTTVAYPKSCAAAYFQEMRQAVGRDFFGDLTKRQLTKPWRIMRPSARLWSFQEALDKGFLQNATFGDIADDRAFFFNTVSYDTGQRFVFSNAAIPHPLTDDKNLLPSGVRALSFSTPDMLLATPDDFPLSMAVATSAAFPPYLGPLTLQFDMAGNSSPRYRHLGDGGVLENSGIETLREVALSNGAEMPALIYAFDAGQSLNKDLSQNRLDISIFSADLSQFVDVLLSYAGAQREAFFEELITRNGLQIEVKTFDYLNVENIVRAPYANSLKWTSWTSWPEGCAAHSRDNSTPPFERLRDITTDLRISDCDAALITQA
ncbi:MAG: putative acylesterase/phospholipase RssA, partial [Reinekea sp.]